MALQHFVLCFEQIMKQLLKTEMKSLSSFCIIPFNRYSALPGEDPYIEIEEDEDEDITNEDNLSEDEMVK